MNILSRDKQVDIIAALAEGTRASYRVRRIMGLCGLQAEAVTRAKVAVKGDQYTYVALAASAKAILAYRTSKRDSRG